MPRLPTGWITILASRPKIGLHFRRRLFLTAVTTLTAAAILYFISKSEFLSRRIDDQVSFESELWPGEAVPRITAKNQYLELYRRPSLGSPLVRIHTIQRGAIIEFDESRYRTVSAGLITANHNGHFTARDFGKTKYLTWAQYYHYRGALLYKKLEYREGDQFGLLQYRANLSCLISFQESVWEVTLCPQILPNTIGRSGFTGSVPRTEWWIRVLGAKRQSLGWLLIEGEMVEIDGYSIKFKHNT